MAAPGGGGPAKGSINDNAGTSAERGKGDRASAQEPNNGNADFRHLGITFVEVEQLEEQEERERQEQERQEQGRQEQGRQEQERQGPEFKGFLAKLEEKNVALQPYINVKNLHWIKSNTVYSLALEEWDRVAKLLADRVDRMEKRSGDLKNEVYQLVGFFTVFQGVVLTAVTQLAQNEDEYLNCKKVWSFALLTALAWFATTVGVFFKLKPIQRLDDQCSDEGEHRQMAVAQALRLRQKGSAFRFSKIKEMRKIERKELWGVRRSFWLWRFAPVVVTLSVFTGIFIAAYFSILCNRGLAHIRP